MKISDKGLELIKRYEGLRLTAYKPVKTEKYWTIGYGHYGSDVRENMTITEQQADVYLRADVGNAERAVNQYDSIYGFTQGQYDALVSFTYNCGAGNLKKLVNNGMRTIPEISRAFMLYNKAGDKVLAGLTRRRTEEKTLFDGASSGSARQTIKKGSKGATVKEMQELLNKYGYGLKTDGSFGELTEGALKDFQRSHGLTPDGICGKKTWNIL